MSDVFITRGPDGQWPDGLLPVWMVAKADYDTWRAGQPSAVRGWLAATGFEPAAGALVPVPDAEGAPAGYVLGLGDGADPFVAGVLPAKLPERATVRLVPAASGSPVGALDALAIALGAYRFTRYKAADRAFARVVAPDGVDIEEVSRMAAAIALVRDLVNTPAEDMGPDALEAAARTLAGDHGARVRVICGEELLAQNYPMIHAVGRAGARAPRLIDLAWGREDAPKVTLVGKGVSFDTGGLDLKPSSAMRLMKKDMGGAANALGLAAMIMGAGLDVRLRVLIPAVENAVAGNAFRPGDVLQTRKGLTVEIGNTDAEGRLILGDALAEADSEQPDLLIDLATLTGAARVALGADLPPFFTGDEALAAEIVQAAEAVSDPVWRLPLWQPYEELLSSDIADIANASESGFAGAITAALFLKRFVTATPAWVHLDIYAWNQKARPGRPKGGEAMAIRALYHLVKARHGG
ncbi:leucyl aminopeptidase family protein [Futiania mangrovi]|uniref:Leucyl aminopeptidase family protein n=1 Tax=Futiania mangrovi TaxID=2959716 RepID=A0A9J6PEN0_9PROT|nr:leucyl aminopeptidase family protein [Futiania mangrovii]MCP1336878.1 leucyl aminopeptidase family protein [Futiania mangrovii]